MDEIQKKQEYILKLIKRLKMRAVVHSPSGTFYGNVGRITDKCFELIGDKGQVAEIIFSQDLVIAHPPFVEDEDNDSDDFRPILKPNDRNEILTR